MLKVGFIGFGSITGAHLPGYQKLAREGIAQVEAYCDQDPLMLEKVTEGRVYTAIDDFLEGERGRLDAVDICLPTYLHADAAIRALEAGFHVMVEKPMALTYADAQRMCETAQRTGRTLMVAQCCRFSDFMTEAKKYMARRPFGRPITASFKRDFGRSLANRPTRGWFTQEALSGGAILDVHIHDADVMQALFGMPVSVSTGAMKVIPGDGYSLCATNYYYPSMFAQCTGGWAIANNSVYGRLSRIDFEYGHIIDTTVDGKRIFRACDYKGHLTDLTPAEPVDMYEREIRYFLGCVERGEPVSENPPEQSAQSIRIVRAEIESADNRGMCVTL